MLEAFFQAEKIEFFSFVSRNRVRVIDPCKMERMEEEIGTVRTLAFFLIPYYAGQKTTNLSVYAQPLDYHRYVSQLEERLKTYWEEKGKTSSLRVFADTSPVDERQGALTAGLGVRGKNGLLIHPKYGSFVFIGVVFLTEEMGKEVICEEKRCLDCGACERICPTGAILDFKREKCLSAITQKKKLTLEEEGLLCKADCKWGCDLCQNVCPMNRNVAETPISFFRENRVERLTLEGISEAEERFRSRAYSWRGREILKRNLER